MDLITASTWLSYQIKTAQHGFAAGKIGTSEFNALKHYFQRQRQEQQQPYPIWITTQMIHNAGFWNGVNVSIDDALDDWSQQTIKALQTLDAVVTWNPEEKSQELEVLAFYAPKAQQIPLRALEPYYSDTKYTMQMTQGKIAVVSPFAASIEKQWLKKSQLFPDPIFGSESSASSKQEIVAIQSHYGPFMTVLDTTKTWSKDILEKGPNAAIQHLTERVINSGARYAFVGIGALSLPLVAALKAKGIVAIHTGGATQIMFGVKGHRWQNHAVISKFFNEHWISPSVSEVPSGASAVEGGCYW